MFDAGLTVQMGLVLEAVRERAPMVHLINPSVSQGFVADALLAAGAQPMITDTPEEAPALVDLAEALFINLGSLSHEQADTIPVAVQAAVAGGKPWVLDPFFVGPTPVRTPLARSLLGSHPAVVRANSADIMTLGGADAEESARSIARQTGGVVTVWGDVDLVTDGARMLRLANGTPLMNRASGTTCVLGALTAACVAVSDPWTASSAAIAWLNIAGERAAARSAGPGSFRVNLVDELANVGGDEIALGVQLA